MTSDDCPYTIPSDGYLRYGVAYNATQDSAVAIDINGLGGLTIANIKDTVALNDAVKVSAGMIINTITITNNGAVRFVPLV